MARSILASNADLVFAVGLKAAIAAKLEILDIPVIACLVLDPEKHGLPTSNMVGLSLQIPFEQQLKPLQVLIPKLARIGLIFDPHKTQGQRDQLEQHARTLGLTLVSLEVHSEREVPGALKSLKTRVEALLLLPDSTVLTENTLDFLISSTLEAHIPLIGFSADLVRSGAVTGTYINYADLGRRAATLVPGLLTTTTSSLLGTIVPPDVIHQAINLKSARYLGLSLTPEVLRSFDEHF
jgi:putative ABC transport system substrate-binding protein